MNTGGYGSASKIVYNNILRFNTSTLEWKGIGAMTYGRYGHAVSTVPLQDVSKFCEIVWTDIILLWMSQPFRWKPTS